MDCYINNASLPVGVSYYGLWNGKYFITIETVCYSWPKILGSEEVDVLETIELSKRDADKAGVVFPIDGMPDSDIKHLSPKHSLDDIYKIWQNLRLPMPILGRATLDAFLPVSKDSILLPENARRYNDELNRQKHDQ